VKTPLAYLFIRACLSALIILSLARPFSASAIDAQGYLCNPSGQSASIEANIKLREFLVAVGEVDENSKTAQGEHCFECLASSFAVLTSSTRLGKSSFHREHKPRAKFDKGPIQTQRGPPVGERAPPIFQ